jgi:hypothetical protein
VPDRQGCLDHPNAVAFIMFHDIIAGSNWDFVAVAF